MNFDNVRRMAERGLKMAQSTPMESSYIDVFQHILDEYEREARSIRSAALDEAAKVAENNAGYSSGNAAKLFIAEEIKELKE